MALIGGGTQESILPAGGSQGGPGGGPQPGDRRWKKNNVGLLEEQVWTGSRWMATGQVRNPIDTAGAAGAVGRTQFESERALDEAQARLATANAALAELEATTGVPVSPYQQQMLDLQRQQLKLQKLQAENDLRAILYGEYGATKRTLIQEKGQARLLKAQLQGKDPFQQAALLSGGVMRGTSPAEAFGKELSSFIDQPIPGMSMDMTPEEMQGILSLMGTNQGPVAPTFGMAQGGIIEMERDGAGGPFSMKQSFIVGEGKRGEGLAAGTAEILTVGDGQVEVTPLAGAFAEGGNTWLDQMGGLLSARQALAPLYAGMGLSRVPITKRGGGINFPVGAQALGPFSNKAEMLSAFGVTPELVKGPGGTIYLNEDGNLRPFTSFGQFKGLGYKIRDVVNLGGPALAQYGTAGAPISGNMPIVPPTSPGGAFGAAGAPIIEPSTGIMLPAVHKLAGIWDQITPAQKINIYSAYSSAGIYPEVLDAQLGAATPQAGAFGGRRIGFTGGYM